MDNRNQIKQESVADQSKVYCKYFISMFTHLHNGLDGIMHRVLELSWDSENFTHLYLSDVHSTSIIIKKTMTQRNVNYECPILKTV